MAFHPSAILLLALLCYVVSIDTYPLPDDIVPESRGLSGIDEATGQSRTPQLRPGAGPLGVVPEALPELTTKTIDRQKQLHNILASKAQKIKALHQILGSHEIVQGSVDDIVSVLKQSISAGHLKPEVPILLLESWDSNENWELDDDELTAIADGNHIHHWNVHLHRFAELPKPVERTSTAATRQGLVRIFSALKAHIKEEGIPKDLRRYMSMKDRFPKLSTEAPVPKSAPRVALLQAGMKARQQIREHAKAHSTGHFLWTDIKTMLGKLHTDQRNLKSSLRFASPQADTGPTQLLNLIPRPQHNKALGQDCGQSTECSGELICASEGKCIDGNTGEEVVVEDALEHENGIENDASTRYEASGCKSTNGGCHLENIEMMLEESMARRAIDATVISANRDDLTELRKEKTAALWDLARQNLRVQESKLQQKGNQEFNLNDLLKEKSQSFSNTVLDALVSNEEAVAAGIKADVESKIDADQKMSERIENQQRMHNIAYSTLEQDMADVEADPDSLKARYPELDPTQNASPTEADRQTANDRRTKDETQRVKDENEQRDDKDGGTENESEITLYSDEYKQNLGQWELAEHVTASIDAEVAGSVGICGMAVCAEIGASVKAEVSYDLGEGVSVSASTTVHATVGATAGYQDGQVVITSSAEVGVAVNAGVTHEKEVGAVTITSEAGVEVGVVATAEATATCGSKGCEAEYEAFAGAYARADAGTTVGTDEISGTANVGVISPGAVGLGGSQSAAYDDGKATFGAGGCIAAAIAGLCVEMSLTVDVGPLVTLGEDTLGPAFNDMGNAVESFGDDVGDAFSKRRRRRRRAPPPPLWQMYEDEEYDRIMVAQNDLMLRRGKMVKTQSSCQHARGMQNQYMDRQNPDCGSYGAFASLEFTSTNCGDNSLMKYRYDCVAVNPHSAVTHHDSQCADLKERDVEYFDRQWVACAGHEAVVNFRIQDCRRRRNVMMKTNTKCKDVGLHSIQTYYTSCQRASGVRLEYLDRQDFECPAEYPLLNSYRLIKCDGQNQKTQYKCGKSGHELALEGRTLTPEEYDAQSADLSNRMTALQNKYGFQGELVQTEQARRKRRTPTRRRRGNNALLRSSSGAAAHGTVYKEVYKPEIIKQVEDGDIGGIVTNGVSSFVTPENTEARRRRRGGIDTGL